MTTSTSMNPGEDTLLIRGVNIPVRNCELSQADLRFFVDNPRIYSILRANGEDPDQVDIERTLCEMDHVKALIQDIRRDGGLTDPVIVKDGSLEVLEGNSRLAAYRVLFNRNPSKWARMKCKVLPSNLDEKLIFALLGQYHIRGKKDWAPFEQAGFLYRRSTNHDIGTAQLAQEIGLTKPKVEHLVATYQFMLDHDETDTARWSYYDEYLKSRKVKKARLAYSSLDDLVVEKIKSGEIARAVDVRDNLPTICSVPKVLKKFAHETSDFNDALAQAVDAGADSTPVKRLSTFRQWLVKRDLEDALLRTQGQARRKIVYELDKVARRAKSLQAKLNS